MSREMIDQTMERASEALVRMDYLTCEDLCLEALAAARAGADWAYYGRVLLPLQEARRQRRMTAAEGRVRLGTENLNQPPERWLETLGQGCVIVTGPDARARAAALEAQARKAHRYVEVLCAASADDGRLTIRTFQGPEASVGFPAPPDGWRERWLEPEDHDAAPDDSLPPTPADFFLDAQQALGDACLAQVDLTEASPQSVEKLEQCLRAVADHEILHQRLAEVAHRLAAE